MDEVLELLEDTRRRLKVRMGEVSRLEIAEQAGVGRYWLEKFDQGVLTNPTIENVRKLRIYLVEGQGLPQCLAPAAAPTEQRAA